MNEASTTSEGGIAQPRTQSFDKWTASANGRTLLLGLFVSIGYYLGAKLGFELTFHPHPVSVLWPPNSIITAALLLTAPRKWWFVLLVALPAHWAAQMQSQVPPAMILCWFVSNCLESLIGAGCVRLLIGDRLRLDRVRNVAIFCFCVVFLGPFLSSFADGGFVIWNRWGEGQFWELWRIRFTSNVLAALTVTPLIVTWSTSGRQLLAQATRRRYAEAALLFVSLFLITDTALYEGSLQYWLLPYLPLPFLIWAAVRFGSTGASTAVSSVAFLAIWSAAHDHGPFSGGAPEQNALSIQIFLIVLSVPILFLGAVIEQLATGEIDLNESEARFRTAADAAPIMIWMSGIDKLCTFFNKAWLDFTGRTMEEERGDGWSSGVHVDDFGKCLKTYVNAFDARKPFAMQYRLKNKDGDYCWITDHGVPRFGPDGGFRGYVGACSDITDLIKKERALRQFEERVALAAESVRFGAWEVDLATNKMWMSDKARDLFYFERCQAIDYETFQGRVHPEDREKHASAMKHAIETQGGYEMEYRILFPDGTVRWIGGRARCVADETGRMTRLLGISMDVTEQKLAEEENRRRRKQIELLSRAGLLGEMTASLAHELNQPLTAILNNANAGIRFIDSGTVDAESLREILTDVAADGHRATEIINNVRSAIKKGGSIRGPVNMNDVVATVAHMVQPDAAIHGCEVKMSLAKNLLPIEGDPVQIQQILMNLVSNAFDAMRSTPVTKRKVEIVTEGHNATICVSVRDHGAGIPEEMREQLFEHFVTTKEEGLGLGLAIVRSIVEAHGGKIGAENVDGGGARFYFNLPVSKDS